MLPRRRKRRRRRRTYEVLVPGIGGELRPQARPRLGIFALRWPGPPSTVLSFLLVVGIGALLNQFFLTDDFYVYQVQVEGNHWVPTQEIIAASGLEGMSIFWVDPAQVESALQSIPMVAQAQVHCRVPNQVRIVVAERRPSLIWQQGERQMWVDDEGVALVPRGELHGVPVVQASGDPLLQPGMRLSPSLVTGVRELRRLLPQVEALQYAPDTGLSFQHPLGCVVHLGDGEDMPAKIAVLEALVQQLEAEGVRPRYIDLRYPELPVYK